MKYRRKINFKTFTLIELIVVIAIIGILAAIGLMQFYKAKDRTNYSRVLADMTQIAKAVKVYAVQNNNVYPADKPHGEMPDGLAEYFNGSWPTTPCGSSYSYDYQYWDSTTCGTTTSTADFSVGINFAYTPTGSSPITSFIKYLDIKNFASTCGTDKGSSTEKRGGDDIFDTLNKEITCSEQ